MKNNNFRVLSTTKNPFRELDDSFAQLRVTFELPRNRVLLVIGFGVSGKITFICWSKVHSEKNPDLSSCGRRRCGHESW